MHAFRPPLATTDELYFDFARAMLIKSEEKRNSLFCSVERGTSSSRGKWMVQDSNEEAPEFPKLTTGTLQFLTFGSNQLKQSKGNMK